MFCPLKRWLCHGPLGRPVRCTCGEASLAPGLSYVLETGIIRPVTSFEPTCGLPGRLRRVCLVYWFWDHRRLRPGLRPGCAVETVVQGGGRPLQVWAPEPCRCPVCRTFLVHGALAAGGGGRAFPCQSECPVRIKPRL